MKENEKDLYKKAIDQIPVRTGKIKKEVMERYNCSVDKKYKTYKFVPSVAIAMIVVILAAFISPKTEALPLKVYAAEGEYVQLGKEAVNLKAKQEPYLLTYSILNTTQNQDYSCVFNFDIYCDSEEVEKITYIIEGEKTVRHIEAFSENSIWFAEVSDREMKQNAGKYPFDYRYMENGDNREVFTYLGNKFVVDKSNQNSRNFYIEYKINPDENGELCADDFAIQIILEYKDGSLIEKRLNCKPIFKLTDDAATGIEIVNELWVNIE
jgi:hypothetical protein